MNFNIDAASEAIKSIYANPSLGSVEKRMRAAPILSAAETAKRDCEKRLADVRYEHATANRFIAIFDDMRGAWGVDFEKAESPTPWGGGLTIQANDCSRLHKLAEFFKEPLLGYGLGDEKLHFAAMPADVKPFVIAHDWLAVIGNQDGDVRLPYDRCAFEFRANGRTVIVLAEQYGEGWRGSCFYEAASGDWLSIGNANDTQWQLQVNAVCIVLDAEVATFEAKPAPIQLNHKRISAGKVPLYDFHVVDLSTRHDKRRGIKGAKTHSKRLHFCRGHWRHYETAKTWVRWCLKGNPDLGIVLKEYRV